MDGTGSTPDEVIRLPSTGASLDVPIILLPTSTHEGRKRYIDLICKKHRGGRTELEEIEWTMYLASFRAEEGDPERMRIVRERVEIVRTEIARYTRRAQRSIRRRRR